MDALTNAIPALDLVPTGDLGCKAFATLRARLALAGYALTRSDTADGIVTFYASRWGLVRELRDLDAVEDFAERVGAES